MPDCNQKSEMMEKKVDQISVEIGETTITTNGTTNGSTNGTKATNGHDDNPPCKISRDGFYGRHLVATRDIAVGEVILQEAPLVSGPPRKPPCCVACLTTSRRPCRRGCGWPICSDTCADSLTHVAECEITRQYRREEVSLDDWDQLRDTLIVLRCLWCRASNPGVWAKLSALESHCDKRKQTGNYEKDRVTVAQFLRRYFKLEDVFTEEDILKICGALQVNGYGVRLTSPSYTAVYDILSFIEHHCTPNCAKSWSTSGVLTVRACAPVLKGAHLSISYTEPLWGTAARRHHLSQELLACRCERCADPSEHGTNYSAISCADTSCTGFMLPEEPLADGDVWIERAGASAWRCDACHVIVSPEQVSAILSVMQDAKMASAQRGDELAWREFILAGKQVLHPHHYWMTEARIALAQMIGRGKQGLLTLSDTQISEKTLLCRELIKLADTLFTAVPRVSGVLRYELQRTLVEEARRRNKTDSSFSARLLVEARQLLSQAESILLFEPLSLPEGEIGQLAKSQLEEFEQILVNPS